MKNLLTGAAQSVTDANERVRKLFDDRPMETPTPRERQNRPRKTFTKAVAEDQEDVVEDDAPVAEASDGGDAGADTPEADEAPFIEENADEE